MAEFLVSVTTDASASVGTDRDQLVETNASAVSSVRTPQPYAHVATVAYARGEARVASTAGEITSGRYRR